MVAAEGNGFFEAKNTACSEYYPSFQVYQIKTKLSILVAADPDPKNLHHLAESMDPQLFADPYLNLAYLKIL